MSTNTSHKIYDELIELIRKGNRNEISIYECVSLFLRKWNISDLDINSPIIDIFIAIEDDYHEALASLNAPDFDMKNADHIDKLNNLNSLNKICFQESCSDIINYLENLITLNR